MPINRPCSPVGPICVSFTMEINLSMIGAMLFIIANWTGQMSFDGKRR